MRPLSKLCCSLGVKGTLLLAREGINGTIAGTPEAVDRVLDHIRALPGCQTLELKFADAETPPFHRMKVRVKREIVTLGAGDLDPASNAGTYVEPADWNALIARDDVVVIDTRNAYEAAIGAFEGAIDPKTASFATSPPGSAPSARPGTRPPRRRRWRCSAPAASAARSPRPS
jgi:UPF0176 protein